MTLMILRWELLLDNLMSPKYIHKFPLKRSKIRFTPTQILTETHTQEQMEITVTSQGKLESPEA